MDPTNGVVDFIKKPAHRPLHMACPRIPHLAQGHLQTPHLRYPNPCGRLSVHDPNGSKTANERVQKQPQSGA